MNRVIKFRGKQNKNPKDNGWLYGSLLVCDDGQTMILDYVDDSFGDKRSVCPDTVGQFTGLYDKNGKEIYEGDILLFCDDIKFEVKFHYGGFGYTTPWGDFLLGGNPNFDFNPNDKDKRFEIIGNIHDNPELLEGGNDE